MQINWDKNRMKLTKESFAAEFTSPFHLSSDFDAIMKLFLFYLGLCFVLCEVSSAVGKYFPCSLFHLKELTERENIDRSRKSRFLLAVGTCWLEMSTKDNNRCPNYKYKKDNNNWSYNNNNNRTILVINWDEHNRYHYKYRFIINWCAHDLNWTLLINHWNR